MRSPPLMVQLSFVALAGSVLLVSQTAGATGPPARTIVAQAKADWLRTIRASSKTGDRATRFPSPARSVLMRRLRRAQRDATDFRSSA
jgi:hypothetical protein